MTACSAHISKTNILDQRRIDLALFKHLFQERVYNVVEVRIFETTLLSFCERGSDGKGNDNVVGVLLGASRKWSACQRRAGKRGDRLTSRLLLSLSRTDGKKLSLIFALPF